MKQIASGIKIEIVREHFYENKWLLHAMKKLGKSMVRLIELTKGNQWPKMSNVLKRR